MKHAFWAIAPVLALLSSTAAAGQEPAAAPAKPTEHVMGTVTGIDNNLHTVSVKEDGKDAVHTVQVGETKTLLKVAPGAKDMKDATRITADDLAVGDRVDVRGFKVDADPDAIAARSVILMSGRDVQQAHQAESAAWQGATAGIVTASDATSQKLTVSARGTGGTKVMIVDASHAQFTRFSPTHPKTPDSSQFADIRSGDQVRIIGEPASDGAPDNAATITARKIYSGTFRNIAGTVVSVAPDGKSLVVKDLANKQPVNIALGEQIAAHKLPPAMASMLARRFNPDAKPAEGGTASDGPPAGPQGNSPRTGPGSMPPDGAGSGSPTAGTNESSGGMHRMRGNGDLSQMLEHLPPIAPSDLKPGDAVVVSGSPSPGASSGTKPALLATAIIAGVEPIFQSASPRQAQSLGEWSSGLGGVAAEAGAAGSAPPQ